MQTKTTLPIAALLIACGGAPAASPPASAEPNAAAAPPAATPEPVAGDVVTAEGFLLEPLPRGVTSFGTAVLGSHLYVLGGYFGTPHAYSREYQSDAVWRLDLDGGRWEALPPLSTGLQGVVAVPFDGAVVHIGGTDIRNTEGEPWDMHSVADVARLDPESLRGAPLPSLPAPRSSHDAVVVDGRLYVVGGWQLAGSPEQSEWHDTMLVLEPDATSWRSVEAPFRRRALAAATAGGKVVAIGGMGPGREISARVDVYDPQAETWARGPDFPGQSFGVAAAGAGDAVLASGSDGAVWRWTPGAEEWTQVGELAFPRFFHRMEGLGDGDVVALGGIGRMGSVARTRHVERFDPDATEPRVAAWTMPHPGRAKNRQGLFLRGETLHLFGGNDSVGQHDFEPHNFLSEAFALHLPSLEVLPMADLPARRQTLQTVLTPDGERGIAAGGFGHDGEAAVTHPEVYVYDFETNEWTERPGGLPQSRSQFGFVEHEGTLWVFGGLDYDPARPGAAAFEHPTGVLSAPLDEPETPFQPAGVDLPGPRRAFAGAVLDGRYHIVGGMRGGFELVDDCVAFDFAARSFEPMACPDRPRLSGEMVALGERLYLAGGSVRGEDGLESDPRLLAFDPSEDAWSVVLDEIPLEPKHLRMMAWGEYLLLYSAHDAEEDVLRFALVRVPSGGQR